MVHLGMRGASGIEAIRKQRISHLRASSLRCQTDCVQTAIPLDLPIRAFVPSPRAHKYNDNSGKVTTVILPSCIRKSPINPSQNNLRRKMEPTSLLRSSGLGNATFTDSSRFVVRSPVVTRIN